ncbi:hypothetical protein HK405_010319, partial [Cladochytrium tenue]
MPDDFGQRQSSPKSRASGSPEPSEDFFDATSAEQIDLKRVPSWGDNKSSYSRPASLCFDGSTIIEDSMAAWKSVTDNETDQDAVAKAAEEFTASNIFMAQKGKEHDMPSPGPWLPVSKHTELADSNEKDETASVELPSAVADQKSNLFRIMYLHQEKVGGSLVEKILLDQDDFRRLIDSVAPGAYCHQTRINFHAVDALELEIAGVYGRRSEITSFFRDRVNDATDAFSELIPRPLGLYLVLTHDLASDGRRQGLL